VNYVYTNIKKNLKEQKTRTAKTKTTTTKSKKNQKQPSILSLIIKSREIRRVKIIKKNLSAADFKT